MKASSHAIAVSRIRKLVLRDTWQVLSDACTLKIATSLSSAQSTPAASNKDDEFQSRDVTILLADLRDFTAIAADRSAGEVLRMLNPVLLKMSEIIFKHGGTIDKFMGCSIMAPFGLRGQLLIVSLGDSRRIESRNKSIARLRRGNEIPASMSKPAPILSRQHYFLNSGRVFSRPEMEFA